MKRRPATIASIVSFIIVFTIVGGAQEPAAPKTELAKPAQSLNLPLPIAEKITQVEQRTAQLQQDLQTLQLLRENLVLTAALELGLSKKDLEGMQLSRDSSGQLRFVRAGKPIAGGEKKDAGGSN